ncbi:hypothetical protein TOPH_04866, partial [Tolypocladium ophioglossoides CBS 100239]
TVDPSLAPGTWHLAPGTKCSPPPSSTLPVTNTITTQTITTQTITTCKPSSLPPQYNMASGAGQQNQSGVGQNQPSLFAVFNPPQVVKASIAATNLRINDLQNMLLGFQRGFRDNAVDKLGAELEHLQFTTLQSERAEQQARADLQEELDAARANVERLTADGDLQEAKAEVVRLTDQLREGQERIKDLIEREAHVSGLTAENEALFNDKASMRDQIQGLWNQARENQTALEESDRLRERAEQRLAEADRRLGLVEAERDHFAQRSAVYKCQAEDAEKEVKTVRESYRALESSHDGFVKSFTNATKTLTDLGRDYDKSTDECRDLRGKVEEGRGNVERMFRSLTTLGPGQDMPWRAVAASVLSSEVVDGADRSVAPLALLAPWPADDSAPAPAASRSSIHALVLGMVDVVDQKPLWRDDFSVAHCRLGDLQQALVSLPPLEGMSKWALTLLDSMLTYLASDGSSTFVVRVAACQILRVLEARWPAAGTTRLTPESIGQKLGQVSAVQGQLVAALCFHQGLLTLPEPARDYVHIASDVDDQSFALICPSADEHSAAGVLVVDGEHHTMWWVDTRRIELHMRALRIVLRAPPRAGSGNVDLIVTDGVCLWASAYIPAIFGP